MLIYVHLLCLDFKCRTFFWAAVYVECRTAHGLFECIEAHCEAMDVPIEKIFFYASDGASVISSDRGGLAGLLRAKSAVLTITHCLVHREALGMKDTVEQSEWAQWFDEWLHDLLNTFARSTMKNIELAKLQLALGAASETPSPAKTPAPIRLDLRLPWAASRPAAASALGVAGGERGKWGGAWGLFRAKSWGYSAFQYILPDQTPKTNRCASRFAVTASALRASAAEREEGGSEIAQFP